MLEIGEPHVIVADIGKVVGPDRKELPRLLPGRVVYINRAHR